MSWEDSADMANWHVARGKISKARPEYSKVLKIMWISLFMSLLFQC